MITFKDLIKDVFNTFGLDMQTVQENIQKLKISNIQPNSLVAGMNAYKYFKSQSEVFYVSENVIDMLCELCSEKKTVHYDTRNTESLICNELYNTIFHNVLDPTDKTFNFLNVRSWILASQSTEREVVCGYLSGRPIKVNFIFTQTDDRSYISCEMSVDGYTPRTLLYWNDDGTMNTEFSAYEETLLIPIYGDIDHPDLPTSIEHITISDVSNELDDGVCNNQVLCELITAAQANGAISKASITAILENYEGCSAASELKQRISCIDELSSTNVMSLIGAYLRDATSGAYEEGEEYYEPLKTPKFTRNLVGTIVMILLSVVSVVLSIVFKAAAAIIAVVWTVVSAIINAISQALPDTNPTFTRTAELPVWNYPLYTRTNIPIRYRDSEWSWDFTELVYEPMQEFGSVAAINSEYEALCIWMAQDGVDEFRNCPSIFAQVLFPCWRYYVTNFGEYRISSDGDPIVFHVSIPIYEGCQQYAASQACDYTWLEYTQASSAAATGQITHDLVLRIVSLARSIAQTADNETSKIDFQCPALPSSIAQLTATIDYVKLAYPDMNIHDLSTIFFCLFRRLQYNDPDWEASFEDVIDLMNSNYVQAACAFYLLAWMDDVTIGADTADFVCGHDCLEPCGEFPTIAKGAIFRMILSIAVMAAVTAAVTIGVKAYRKKQACKRLALRESQFEAAKKAYLEDPDDKDKQKALKRANRKLDRAWTKASRAGLKTWNGFATGAESEATSFEEASEKLNSEYSNMDDTAISNGTATVSIDSIVSLISGPEPAQS